jgi:hypothetical protein
MESFIVLVVIGQGHGEPRELLSVIQPAESHLSMGYSIANCRVSVQQDNIRAKKIGKCQNTNDIRKGASGYP